MAFDETLVNDVLKHSDIVKVIQAYLPLVRKGKDYLAKCPFHDDTNPSMHVSPEKQIFKCFVCIAYCFSPIEKIKFIKSFAICNNVTNFCFGR